MKQRDVRRARGMTQRAFAAAIGVHYVTACHYEHGGIPSPRVMRRIREKFPEIHVATYYGQPTGKRGRSQNIPEFSSIEEYLERFPPETLTDDDFAWAEEWIRKNPEESDDA